MISPIVQVSETITLLGGGDVTPGDLALARRMAPVLVAADGGADAALAAGWAPDAVIGDMDSISEVARAALPADRVHPITEQDSTDFDKCLRSISAPLVLGLGFLGARLDHQMAVLNGLVRHAQQRCVLLGDHDLIFLCPTRLRIDLPVGTRLSLFPMAPVTGTSRGLKWPIDGIDFAPHARVGTSNEVTGPVEIGVSAPAMLVIMPRASLDAALAALRSAG